MLVPLSSKKILNVTDKAIEAFQNESAIAHHFIPLDPPQRRTFKSMNSA